MRNGGFFVTLHSATNRQLMKKIEISSIRESMIDAIGKEWMLVTAGTLERFNTMTASWGGIGYLWNRPVAFVFIRPERYTHEFVENGDRLTLSFLGEGHRDILNFCGTKSGRDHDKAKETGLRPVATENGCVAFEQARLTLECRKLYKGAFEPGGFIDKSCLERWYNERPGGGLHDVYVVEIENAYEG